MMAIGHLCILISLQLLLLTDLASPNKITELEIDNYHCKPEVLKNQRNYYCTVKGEIVCRNGYQGPETFCKTPVCSPDCKKGKCIAPELCACQVGWSGKACDVCLRRPGCVHGYCDEAFDCLCDDGYEGGLCDKPACSPACGVHGKCTAIDTCTCHPGWTGPTCEDCVIRAGCVNGFCVEGNDCICNDGWQGPLCDIPVCDGCSHHGQCVEPGLCKCDLGWKNDPQESDLCTECLKADGCPDSYVCNLGFGCIDIRDWENQGPCYKANDDLIFTMDNCTDAGLQRQTRKCIPWEGCPGCNSVVTERTVPCDLDPCPIDGGLGDWTEFGTCSSDCSHVQGIQVRRRFCTNPVPTNGGRECSEIFTEEEQREQRECTGDIDPQSTDVDQPCFDIGGTLDLGR